MIEFETELYEIEKSHVQKVQDYETTIATLNKKINDLDFYNSREYTLKRNKEEIISRTGECFPWNPLERRGLRHIYLGCTVSSHFFH